MKFTRSLPAKAVARENVPTNTMTLRTLTLQKWRICIRMVNTTRQVMIIRQVLFCTQAFASGVMIVRSLTPLMSMK